VPGLKAPYTPGYTRYAIIHNVDPGTNYLQKPYSLLTLPTRYGAYFTPNKGCYCVRPVVCGTAALGDIDTNTGRTGSGPKTAISPDEHRYAPTILTAAFVGSGRAICIYAMFDLVGKWGAFRSLPDEIASTDTIQTPFKRGLLLTHKLLNVRPALSRIA
jgi:hypothetical protein